MKPIITYKKVKKCFVGACQSLRTAQNSPGSIEYIHFFLKRSLFFWIMSEPFFREKYFNRQP
ncbi:MAG: hypothetical protein VR65_06395 [Desulfobulbaceae bacterium BRH_c16a]|nr:MAG: hypothetical protein VR65_25185 [Desulfobulbaceae bacterium BRH_c16a]KJS02260.1 MAG: hypothetical protein VR65_06395 [Desulfobulbaceae bacterium BRH_c16a]